MERPAHIPESAVYNEKDKQWQIGEKNEDGKNIGHWKMWHQQEHLVCIVEYGNGNPPFFVTRFHPDGTVCETGEWHGGNKWLGTSRYIKSEQPTIEKFPAGGADKAANVWIAEFDYIEEGTYNAQRYFDKQNNPVSSAGDPQPERPASVPERAHFVREQFSATSWVMGTVDTRIGKYIDEYFEWDLGGTLLVKRLYNATGDVVENYEYKNGQLYKSKVYNKDGHVSNYYYAELDPPVIKNSTTNKNNDNDREESFFDKSGKLLYSVRDEKVSKTNQRRYYNGELVCEGFQTKDTDEAPLNVKYYYSGGATLIDYTANSDGSGIWRLYDKAGQELQHIAVSNDDDDFRLKKWNLFLTSWADYDEDTNLTVWEAITDNFNKAHKKFVTNQKLQALPVPTPLQAELEKVNWEDIDTAMRGGEGLPAAINGMLSEDEDVVGMSKSRIWFQIEHQGSVYESTFKVAEILARMLPHYTHLPVVQLRIGKFLYQVLGLYYIRQDDELYSQLTASIEPALPLIMQWAGGADAETAHWAQYILVHAGNDAATEQLLMQEWQQTTHSRARRGYAIFSLCAFYTIRKQNNKTVEVFSAAFVIEKDVFLRFAMAAHLVLATGEEAQDAWLAELVLALANHKDISDDFYSMTPFISDCDTEEYLTIVLQKAGTDTMEKNIGPVIDALPAANALKQTTLLHTIFSVLFQDASALEDITPVRKKALLAAAEVVMKDPGFINHKEVFDSFDLPHDAYALKQLAESAN